MVVRNGINHIRWEPVLVMFQYLDAEQSWILTHENSAKIVIYSVYMVAKVPDGEFRVWNNELYSMISAELMTIQNEGYEVILVGDFNGHVDNDLEGVEGNKADIKRNGRLLWSFIDVNNLTMLNADKQICSGTFTRLTGNSVTLLDFALADEGAKRRVKCMIID